MFDEESVNLAVMLLVTSIAVYTRGLWTGLAIGGGVMVLCLAYALSQVGGQKTLKGPAKQVHMQ